MKKWIALLMTFMMTMVCVCPAGLAADPTDITVTVTDQDGNTYTATYSGTTSFDSDSVKDYLVSLGLSTTDQEKVDAATEQAFSASVPDGDSGPIVLIGTNANGDPVTIEIKSDVDQLHTVDSPTVTLEGDVNGADINPAVFVESGDPTVMVTGDVSVQDGDAVQVVNTGDDAEITIVGDVTSANGYGIDTQDTGKTEITVDGSVEAKGYAIYAQGEATITTGDATSTDENAVAAMDRANVIVDGSVNAKVQGVATWDDSEVTVHGDVTSQEHIGVGAYDSSHVEVDGNVQGDFSAVSTQDKALVLVHGDASAPEGVAVMADLADKYNSMTGEYDVIHNQSSITVEGNVTGMNGIAAEDNAEILAKKDVIAENIAIEVADGYANSTGETYDAAAKVEVEGNVQAGYIGIRMDAGSEKAIVTVSGNVTSDGTGIASYQNGSVGVDQNVTAQMTGIVASGNTEIAVGGNVEAQMTGIEARQNSTVTVIKDVNAQGSGVVARDESQVTVGGNVNGQMSGVSASGASTVQVDGSVVSQGIGVYNGGDGSVKVGQNVTNQNGNGILSTGDGMITVGGNVKSGEIGIGNGGNGTITGTGNVKVEQYGVRSDANATIQIGGNVDSQDNGIVQNAGGEITVGGNVTAKEDGVRANASGSVEVHGDITAGHVETVTTPSGYSYDYPTGTGVNASGIAEVTVDGSVSAQLYGISTMEEATVTVHKDVTSENAIAVSASGTSQVTVDGDVKAQYGAVSADMQAEVTIGGNVEGWMNVADEAKVTVKQDVIGDVDGIYASNGSKVTVNGSVTVDGTEAEESAAIGVSATVGIDHYEPETWEAIPYDGAPTVTVDGDVTVKDGIGVQMDGDAKVIIGGDVTAGLMPEEPEAEEGTEEGDYSNNAYQAYLAAEEEAYQNVEIAEETRGAVEIVLDEENDGQLIIGGTVKAEGESVPVVITYTVDDEAKLTEMPEKLPDIKIYEIAPSDGTYFDVNVKLEKELSYSWVNEETGETRNSEFPTTRTVALSQEDQDALVEAVAAAIQYIIKVDPQMQSQIQIADDFYDAENDLYAAHENEEVSVTLKLDGYDLTATGQYTLQDNGDGTWTLTVQRGGGVTLSAVIRKSDIPAAAGRASAANAEADAGWKDSRVGKKVLLGRYDLDGNGEKEDLEWIVLRVADGSARLGMAKGLEAIPADFDTAFNEEEAAQIRSQITALDRVMSNSFFGDGMVHASMYVNLAALHLD